MNRISKESPAGRRNVPAGSLPLLRRRGLVTGGGAVPEKGYDGLDPFSTDESDVPPISVGSAKLARSGMDDLLSAADMGKHDYDWLLTPPGTPLFSSSDAGEAKLSSVVPRSNPSAKSVSTNKTSRFSLPQSEHNHHGRPAKGSSVTRRSISPTYSSHFSNNTNRTSVLNTSTAPVTSPRPSSPGNHPNQLSATRKSAPTSLHTSRSSTPTKTRAASNSLGEKTKPSHGSRPSTPSSHPHIPTNSSSSSSSNSNSIVSHSISQPSTPTQQAPAPSSNSMASRSISRPSTPTRRAPANSISSRSNSRPSTPTRRAPPSSSGPVATHSSSVGQTSAPNNWNAGPTSRPSSPGSQVRPPAPLLPHDLSLHVPPNIRTKLPEELVAAGRTHPGLTLTVRTSINSEAVAPMNSIRRQSSSPIVTRGRVPENSPKARLPSNGHEAIARQPEIQKSVVSENVVKKPAKTATMTEKNGFGRMISKSSLDMVLRHMDIRQGIGGIRGTSLFPQSIRSTAPKVHRMSDPMAPIVSNGSYGTDSDDTNCKGTISTSCSSTSTASENGDFHVTSPGRDILFRQNMDPDLFESCQYNAFLLKEDSKDTNWLHSIDGKSDQSLVFDHRFEPPPEPFGLP